MELKTAALTDLKDKLYNWESYSEKELEALVTEFEKIPREEFSKFYTPVLSDTKLAEKLADIGDKYSKNTEIVNNSLSAIGNMVKRYGLDPAAKVFNFFVSSIKNKKANYYVSLFISAFPQYKTWDKKWEYLVSIPGIAPKKKSIGNFHIEVKQLISNDEKIPLEATQEIIRVLDNYIKTEPLSDYSKKEYLKTIHSLIGE